ncbi:MAG: hypothetical protein HRT68_03645, partial [Flavobacteriaceae bacterium]|nr:hypothetical protein [Flavobacteriaceae bacterium]
VSSSPYGLVMPNRNESTSDYRYGFQDQEMDDEIKGEGNSINYKFRMHDPRVGRFFAEDPLVHKFPWYSPYQFSGNTPIMSSELEGLEPIVENGILVGYTIQKNQGPTQVSMDINNKETQKKWGYVLQEPITWKKVVMDNAVYYAKKGNWNGSNMLDIDNPVYSRLNSNIGEKLTLVNNEKTVLRTTTKSLYRFNSDFNYWDTSNDVAKFIKGTTGATRFFTGIDDYAKALSDNKFLANYKGKNVTWSLSYYGGGRGKVSPAFVSNAKGTTKALGGLSNAIKYGGAALNVFSFLSTEAQYQNDLMSYDKRAQNHLMTGMGVAFPPAGIGAAIGAPLGEKYADKLARFSVWTTENIIFPVIGKPDGWDYEKSAKELDEFEQYVKERNENK